MSNLFNVLAFKVLSLVSYFNLSSMEDREKTEGSQWLQRTSFETNHCPLTPLNISPFKNHS